MNDEVDYYKTVVSNYEQEIGRLVNAINDHRQSNQSENENDKNLYKVIDPECW